MRRALALPALACVAASLAMCPGAARAANANPELRSPPPVENAPNPPPDAGLFKAVAGKWAWQGTACADAAHTLAFSDDNARMVYTAAKPYTSATGETTQQSRYNVLYAEGNKIAMYLEGERRRTAAGDRVVWVLVLKNADTYAWRRTDWAAGATTKDILRCR